MATVEQLSSALRNAHKAGDVRAAKVLANELKRQRGGPNRKERGSALDPVVQGLTFGFADELAGGIGGAIEAAKGGSFQEGYDTVRNRALGQLEDVRERHPVASTAFEVAGSLPTAAMPLGAVARGATLANKVGRGAATGFGYGAAYGAGTGDDLESRIVGAGQTGLVGGALGGAAPVLGTVASKVVSPLLKRHATRANPAERISQADEFGVPLTRGQATGNLIQTGQEEAMRHGVRGQGPTEVMQEFGERQGKASKAAINDMQSRIAGDGAEIAVQQEAGDIASRGVRDKARALRSEADELYTRAEAGNPIINAQHVRQVKQDFVDRLLATDFPFDEKLHPTAYKAMGEVDRLATLPDKGGPAIQGMALKDIERVRRRMLQSKGTNPDDMRAVSTIRRAFDDWIDDAVDKELFSGDVGALDALKDARSAWSRFRSITTPKTGDDAGRVISKMAKMDVSGQEAANWLYGSSVVNPPGSAFRVAGRLKEILGKDSEAWSAIRQGAWLRVTKGKDGQELGPQALASNIKAFVDGRGQRLAEELYTPSELSAMQRFGVVQRMLVAEEKATNPSRSGHMLARMAQPVITGLASALGFSAGGLGGAVAAATALPILRSLVGHAAARRAVNPRLTGSVFTPENVSGVVADTLGLGGRAATPAIAQRPPLELTVPVPAATP